jgi:acetyl coenzyme A synthetase (ADP forming)-like protein
MAADHIDPQAVKFGGRPPCGDPGPLLVASRTDSHSAGSESRDRQPEPNFPDAGDQRPYRGSPNPFDTEGMTAFVDATVCACDVVLSDGGTVHVRPVRPDDCDDLVAFHARLSPESIYRRFFTSHPRLSPAEVERFTCVDGHDRMGLVATLKGQIVGIARYDRFRAAPAEAEVAFVVEDAQQGRGLGTLLLEHLAAYARTQDVDTFRAETMWDNRPMQDVFRSAGFIEEVRSDLEIVDVRMDIRPTARLIDAIENREQRATTQSVARLLQPRSIAVVGASRTEGTIGHEVLRNILSGGFTGAVYPINPTASSIAGAQAYPSVLDVPDDIDLAVIAVPSARVQQTIDECGSKGVRSLVVISAGFAESGGDGRAVQDQLVARARAAGMRLVGPNCMGIINTAPTVSMNATFAPVQPERGRVAFASQSGGLGIAVLEEARRRGIGLSSFVSVGNKADVSGNDLLRYWEQDGDTDVILLYLESFGNPRRFARIARQVSATKPIIAVKAGRTRSGRRAASSHTAALASPDNAVDALFHQTGVIRVDTLQEMFDTAQLLAMQPIPSGRRVAVVGNAGGPGILAADACEAAGLEVPDLSSETLAGLRSFLPDAASIANPVDMVASASAAEYERALDLVLADDNVDAVVVIFVPPLVTDADDVARAIARATCGQTKPVVANFLGMATAPPPLSSGESAIPNYCFPEPAVHALARACRYGQWRDRDGGQPVAFTDLNTAAVRPMIESVLSRDPAGAWLAPDEANIVTSAYGIAAVESVTVGNSTEAVSAARRVGFPIALKAGAAGLVHKTDRGGVRLSLHTAAEVRRAFDEMHQALGDEMGGAVVQAMASPGVETIVGVVNDASFGPLIMFGTGGTAVELFGDQAFRILPMTDADATDLVRSVRGSPLLFGFRGSEPVDVKALEQLILRVAYLAEDVPEITEMDLNPVIAGANGAYAVDVKIHIAPAARVVDPTLRKLR